MRSLIFLGIPMLFLLTGCVQSIAVSTVGNIVYDGFGGFKEESDLDFAEKALPANLKLLEVLLKNSPEDNTLLILLAEGYCSYALGFVEDEDPDRAREFYVRGRRYAQSLLRAHPPLSGEAETTVEEFRTAVAALTSEDVPAAFWTAFGWGSWINLSLTNPDAIADLPRVEALMDFVLDQDSTFYYAGAHLFLGTLSGSRSRFLGGNHEASRNHFERAIRITRGRFLMAHVYYARSLAVQTLDEELFDRLLDTVDSAPMDVLPEFRLATAIAKNKSRLLRARKPELF